MGKIRIRKLTPRTCFRLMDVDDKYIDRIQNAKFQNNSVIPSEEGKPISESQQYKLAGNSIVVACMEGIFDKLFIHTDLEEGLLF